jgi:putative ABC transport system permease protein
MGGGGVNWVILATASRWYWRGARRGEWLWLWLAVVIASASVVLVEQLANSVHHSMLARAAEALSADLVVRSSRPLPDALKQQAAARGLEVAESITLTTMLGAGDEFQMVRLNAHDRNVPLRGTLKSAAGRTLADLPAAHLLADPELQTLMAIDDTTPLQLGREIWHVGDWLSGNDPLFSGMSSFVPRIVIPIEALEGLGLLGPGSRASYELMFAGPTAAITQWSRQLQAEENPHWQIISAAAPNADLERSLATARLFLELSAFATLLIAGLAILIASRFYLQRWIAAMALMRACGAADRQLSLLFAIQLTWLAIMGGLVGGIAGLLLFHSIVPWLADYFNPLIVAQPWRALLLGIGSALLVLWSFAWPAFREATAVAPQQILRQTRSRYQPLTALIISLLLLVLLMSLILSPTIVRWALPALLIGATGLWLLAVALLAAIRRLQPLSRGWLRLALAALAREPMLVKMQLISLGLVIYLLILLSFVRHDLLTGWQASLPADTPNQFLLNIQPDQQAVVNQHLAAAKIDAELVAIVRGRIIAANDVALQGQSWPPRAQRLLDREANIALLEAIPEHNRIVAELPRDRWPANQPHISVEREMAELLNLQLGDTLTFDLLGHRRSYTLTALRDVVWQSVRMNFFFIIHGEEAQTLPYTLMTNFHMGADNDQRLPLRRTLQNDAPGVLWIDAEAMVAQIERIMQQAAIAVSLLYLFTLGSSLIVILSATRAAQQGRLRSWLLLRTLGAAQRDIVRIGLTEFLLIGLLAGLFAALLAQISSLLISYYWLGLQPQINPMLWIASLLVSITLLLLIALATQYQPLRQSPQQLLRQLNGSQA